MMRPRPPESAARARECMRRCKVSQRARALEDLGIALRAVDMARELGTHGQVRGRALRGALRLALNAVERYCEVR